MKLSKILSNISWSLAEKVMTELMSSVVTILLARLLVPEDYGYVALAQVFINLSSILVTCGLGTALIQNKNIDEEQISTVFYLNIIIGIFVYFVLFITAPALAFYKGNLDLVPFIRVLALRIPIASIYSIQHSYIQKKMQFKKFFFSSFVGTVASCVVGVAMAFSGYGAWALVFSSLIDQTIDCIFLFFSTRWLPKFRISINKTFKTIKFGINVLLIEIVSRSYDQLRNIIIGIKYSSADLAYNTKGLKFPVAIDGLTNAIVAKVIFPVLSELQDNKEKMNKVLRRNISISSYILIPMLIGFASISDRLIPFLLTDKWSKVIPYIKIYCFIYIFGPLNITFNRSLQAIGDGKKLMLINVVSTITDIIILVICLCCFDTAFAVATSHLLSCLVNCPLIFAIAGKEINYSIKNYISDNGATLLSAIIMGIIVQACGLLIENALLCLIVQILIGVIVYLLASLMFSNENMFTLLNYIKEVK